MTDPWSVQKSEKSTEKEYSTADDEVDNGRSGLDETTKSLGFEDSFISDISQKTTGNNSSEDIHHHSSSTAAVGHQPLPDSQVYLKGLERKLEKLKKSSKLVEALAEKREDCLRNLVQSDLSNGGSSHNELLLELETSILNNDSTVYNLYRQLQPVQPLTVGETVNIVKYDQLEEQRLELEGTEEEDDSPASR